MIKVKIKQCLKCEHEWIARVENPVQCPRCKRTDWNKKKVKKNGL